MTTQESKIRVAILGAGGLTGRELMSRLRYHDAVELVFASSDNYAGQPISSVFHELEYYSSKDPELCFSRHSDPLPDQTDIVFLAVPNKSALSLVPRFINAGVKCIDLSGSFRLHNKEVWQKFYKLDHSSFAYMQHVTYGLPEINRTKIKKARCIANPGCYPTGPIIALNILGDYRTQIQSIVIDAKSGVSGAGGRTEDAGFSFQGVYENFRAYKVLAHQHQPEIKEYASLGLSGEIAGPLTFTPHLLPLYRGILSTIVIHWQKEAPADLATVFEAASQKEPFIRYYENTADIMLSHVQHTNYVDMAICSESSVSVIVTAIDNLLKGAAGQAIQNMNLMFGFPEEQGLL